MEVIPVLQMQPVPIQMATTPAVVAVATQEMATLALVTNIHLFISRKQIEKTNIHQFWYSSGHHA